MNTSILLEKINVVPRWIIFSIDLLISFLSLTCAYAISYNFDFSNLSLRAFTLNAIIESILSCTIFFAFKIYAGIIRFTSVQDSWRILCALLTSNCLFFLIHLILLHSYRLELVSGSIIIISGLSSYLFMVTYRILVKYMFIFIKNLKLDKQRVLIYGAGEAGVATKRTLDDDTTVNKNVIAFIDDDQRKVEKTIDGIKILNAKNLLGLIENRQFDELIFASYTIPIDHKKHIIEICLENDIRVLNIPPHEAWQSGKLQTTQIQKINIEDLLNRKPIEIDITSIKNELKGKRILITGAAGSVGSELVRQLLTFEASLIVMCDQSETALHHLYLEIGEVNSDLDLHAFIGDVKDQHRMQYLFETYKPHYVYHAAAYKHVPMMENNPVEAIKTNVLGTKTIADLSVKYGVKKFVMISTDKAVNPTNIMGASKRIAEIYVQSLNNFIVNKEKRLANGPNNLDHVRLNTSFITTRFGNVLGSNGSVIPRFKEQIEKGGPVTVTHPDITRYFMTIPEACRLVLEAGCMGKGGEIFIFDMGKAVKIVDLAKTMIRLTGLTPNHDIKIKYTGLRPGEKLFEELLNDTEKAMPTHHEKIMIGKVREFQINEIEGQIDDLIQHAKNCNDIEVVKIMKEIVAEFKSKNSAFEELDILAKVF
jgi:FlaA1/EpsC-like NDP-sugar epimerase